jgi:hypothetical protein
MSRPRQRGQSLVEYVVLCGALAFVLFVPISDEVSGGESKTTIELVFDGFSKAYKKISRSISYPT